MKTATKKNTKPLLAKKVNASIIVQAPLQQKVNEPKIKKK